MQTQAKAYAERLWPSLATYVFAVGVAASLGVAYWRALGATAGAVTALLAGASMAVILTTGAAKIRVDASQLYVGRAHLPREYIGRVVQLADAREARNLASAYVVTRAGVKHTVLVELTDSSDPHPYWLISTRKPDALIKALSN